MVYAWPRSWTTAPDTCARDLKKLRKELAEVRTTATATATVQFVCMSKPSVAERRCASDMASPRISCSGSMVHVCLQVKAKALADADVAAAAIAAAQAQPVPPTVPTSPESISRLAVLLENRDPQAPGEDLNEIKLR